MKLANSVSNINTAYKITESNTLTDVKGPPTLGTGSCLGYASILIHLLFTLYWGNKTVVKAICQLILFLNLFSIMEPIQIFIF